MDRFWQKTAKRDTGCIEWTGAKLPRGYGRFYWRGKPRYAHRISLELSGVVVPDELMVLHKCDNPSCVNPEHLMLGTQNDNMKDASKKGRCRRVQDWRGVKNPKAKLTDSEIRSIALSENSPSELSLQFNVSKERIYQIRREHRRHLGISIGVLP